MREAGAGGGGGAPGGVQEGGATGGAHLHPPPPLPGAGGVEVEGVEVLVQVGVEGQVEVLPGWETFPDTQVINTLNLLSKLLMNAQFSF